ncbi:AAA family ATPase [Leucothrix mucor]|uniref:AAA family ATPase n=1 Tax=Leucothrix mucor TaxID=45248 RepID=UPI0003B32EE0|nr:AAA family ATPase [Leucothrix mucor]
MIVHFHIDNFKSLVDFNIELSKFSCLIGLNGAGKSSVLQALDFTSALMSGSVTEWLNKRNWDVKDLNSKLVNRSNIKIGLGLKINGQNYLWFGAFNRTKLSLTHESIIHIDLNAKADKVHTTLFEVAKGHYTVRGEEAEPINFRYEGSVLSQLKSSALSPEIEMIKKEICDIRSLDLLSPQSLRLRARKSDKSEIGIGGEQLPVFIHQLKDDQKKQLVEQLQTYYPQVKDIYTKTLRSGWLQLELAENYVDGSGKGQVLTTEPKHINDGTLRLLVILAQQFSPLKTVLFDEIENGINPEVTEQIVDALVASPKQIIVTTHSPMILNYMDDETAKKSVILIYKRDDGQTHATRFFDVPSAAEKLESLAPGDAMLDVYLRDIAKEAESQRQKTVQQEV